MCMANHDTIIERHIYTSEWAVSNLLPSNGAGPPESPGSSPSSSGGLWRDGVDVFRLFRKLQWV